MPFQPDITDMERHRVEFRLAVKKAERRFTAAKMIDAFYAILKDNLPNASEPRDNFVEINRITPDELEKLHKFLIWLIHASQDAPQLELVLDTLRKGLIHAREVQCSNTIEVDPMCLFCMGVFKRVEGRTFRESTPIVDNNNHHYADNIPIDDDVHDHPGQLYEDGLRSNHHHPAAATAAAPMDTTAEPERRRGQLPQGDGIERAQQVVQYQPFQIPPTPDEDANIDDNQDNEPDGAEPATDSTIGDHADTTNTTTTTPQNGGHEDSMHQWFFEGNRRPDDLPRTSAPLEEHIETQKAAFDFEALAATLASHEKEANGHNGQLGEGRGLNNQAHVSPETTLVEQGEFVIGMKTANGTIDTATTTTKKIPKKKAKKQTKKTKTTNGDESTDADLIIKMGVNPKMFANHSGFDSPATAKAAPPAAPAVAQSQQPVSSIDLQVRRSISRAQQQSSSQAIIGQEARRLSSNSKQFIKHRAKGKKRNTAPYTDI